MGLFDRLRSDDGPRVAFIGIDGVPFGLIANNPEVFPTLHELMSRGQGEAIESIVPPESSACWPSLTTGVNPGRTGVYGFQDREIGSYETYVPMGRDVQATRVWDRVETAGRKATVMNVPVTFPPQRNVQRMVSGFLSPDLEKASHPAELAARLEAMDYRIDVDAKLGHNEDKGEFLADAHETIAARHRAFMEFVREDDWDLFFGVYMTTDRVNHFLFDQYERDGPDREEFLSFYEQLDEYLGEIISALPDDVTPIIASDHGFTTLEYEVHLNHWLEENGWLSYASTDHEELADISDETRAYSLIPGRLYLNLEDREPRGGVPREDYSEVRDELAAELEDLRGPDGEQVVDRVVKMEDAFVGEHDAIAPDLVALPRDGFDLKAGFSDSTAVFDRGPRTGMHTFANASLIIDEPDATPEGAGLYDIAPTILSLMEIEYDPDDFDGSTLV